MNMFDITAIGEVLVDFAPIGPLDPDHPCFAANPGGAPANVLAQSAKLGGHNAFIGKVGDDDFGAFLRKNLLVNGIDCRGLVISKEAPTTLAFVSLDETGDRSFSFYRRHCADTLLTKGELDMDLIKNTRIFHFGSVSLTDEPTRSSTLLAAALAKYNGAMISYDPNYRPLLWDDEARAVTEMTEALAFADILKVSEEEALLIAGTADPGKAADFFHAAGIDLVLITMGADGSYFSNGKARGRVDAFPVAVKDTTGSGDAFFGAMLHQLRLMDLEDIRALSEKELRAFVRLANAAGGLTATELGAIPPMPDQHALDALLQQD
jgi:fructokinase